MAYNKGAPVPEGTLIDAARGLVDFANAAGGADNTTVAVVPVAPEEADKE